MIKHTNVIYMPNISALGGIETYVYELVKKYKDLDICVISKNVDINQLKRLKQYCPVYIWKNEIIECDVAIINYDISIIDYIRSNAKIYQVVHYDFTSPVYPDYDKPKSHPRITNYIGITKYLTDELGKLFGKSMLCYNPLTIEEDKPIIIVSATRLHKHKGVDRMIKLINALDKSGINYLWFCLTNDLNVIDKPNVIMIKNRLDISKWLNIATYVCLLSDSEACSYTLNEALYRNIPIITTPLPYLEELGVKDGINAYIMNYDCSNVDEIVNKITNVPKFNFKRLDDGYNKIFKNIKSKYEEELNMKVKVKAIVEYDDCELNKRVKIGEEWITTRERADRLLEYPALVEVVEVIKEDKKEDKKVPTKKVEKKNGK